ncbi:MAG: hypothetical protein MJZ10_14855, partial [Fibrobacter sp.]|nr:hypothetical protein [Fibrobacter sp.]
MNFKKSSLNKIITAAAVISVATVFTACCDKSDATQTAKAANATINYSANETAMAQNEKLELTQEWDKVFPKSEKVDHKKVTFT